MHFRVNDPRAEPQVVKCFRAHQDDERGTIHLHVAVNQLHDFLLEDRLGMVHIIQDNVGASRIVAELEFNDVSPEPD